MSPARQCRNREERGVSMRRIQLFALVGLVAVVAGCGGARPVKYYIIDVPSTPASRSTQAFPISISVGRIITSQLYRMDRIVYGSGSVQLGTYEYERWATAPANMIQDAVITSLRSTGQYLSVSRMGSGSRTDYIV